MPKIIGRIFIFIISLVIALIIGEFLVRKYKPQITFSQAFAKSVDCYAADPDMPFTLAKNYQCRMISSNNEFNTSASLNSLGYRGEEFSLEKPAGKKRILVIGDSMTFGWGLPDTQTYPFLMEKMFKDRGKNNIEVINAGYLGWLSPDGYYLYFKKRGVKLAPDVVIIGFFGWNDIADLAESVWVTSDKNGLPGKIDSCCHKLDGRIFRNKSIEFKYKYPILRESHLYLLLIETLQKKFKLFPMDSYLVPRSLTEMGCTLSPDCINRFYPQEESAYKILQAMKKVADENNIKLTVALLPVDIQLYPGQKEKYASFGAKWFPPIGDENFLGKRLGKNLAERGIEYLDLFADFDKKRDKGYPFFPIDAHFNSIGAEVVAESLDQYLLDKKYLE